MKKIIIISVLFLIVIGYLLSCVVIINDDQVGVRHKRYKIGVDFYVDSISAISPGIYLIFKNHLETFKSPVNSFTCSTEDKVFKVNVNQPRFTRDTLYGMTKEGVKWSTDYIVRYVYDKKKVVDLYKLYGDNMDKNVEVSIKLLYKLSLYAEIMEFSKDSITYEKITDKKSYENIMLKIATNANKSLSSSGINVFVTNFFQPQSETIDKQKELEKKVKDAEEKHKQRLLEFQKAEQELKEIKKRYN